MEKNQSFLVEEVLPQITEVTRPMCEPVSWTIEEDLGQSVESLGEGAARVPTVRFDVGQLMQWPDINSAGVMICGFMLESEMFLLGSVRRAAEPVSVATKSEMLTPVFAGGGGGVVAVVAPLVVVEAVTSRVSVLPVVGSDILTGLSVAAGGADQLLLGSGDILDKVGHGAGQSGVRTFKLREVRNIVFSWMRPVAVLTSQFFLSDEGEDVEMPLHINDGRAFQQRKVDFNYVNICPQMTEGIQSVGPTENRWDGHRILDILCWLCKWMNTQKLDPRYGMWERSGHDKWKLCTGTVPRSIQYPVGNSELSCTPCLRGLGGTTGSVDRKGQNDDDADWFNGNPNRVGGSVITGTDVTVAQYCSYIRGILTKDWALGNRPAVEVSVLGYPPGRVKNTDNKDTAWIRLTCVWLYKCQAGWIVMSSNRFTPVVTRPRTIEEVPSHSSESFLKRVSDSHLDKLYDLPESIIQDVMGLQALRPSAAVCKVMTIPDSNCVRIVTPDEHVNTGFHEILIYDMGQEEWPQVPLSEIGCLRLDWPKDLFAFVGRYQLELEQMRKVCRDRFGASASGTCPTFRLTSVNTWLCITSIWHSYGGARLTGVRFGRGHHRTVWTTCAEHTILQSR